MDETNQLHDGLSVIIPVYNEEKSIKLIITGLYQFLHENFDNFEIIIVDDGSNDGTKALIKKIDLPYRLLEHKRNSGYGAALKTGIKNSYYNDIVIIDADGTYPIERIHDLVQIYRKENYDMVVGARIGENVKMPLIRRPAKWIIAKLASYLSETQIPDLNSGLRVMNKKLIEKFMHILPDGFSFTTSITLALLTNGYSIKYLPIDYLERTGESKIRPIHDTLTFLQLILTTILYYNPLKIFLPMSMILFIAGFLLLLYRIFFSRAFGSVIIILFVSGFQLLAIGMLADLIDKRMKS